MTVLVTGSAGFIGFHVASRLLERGETVVGFDGFTPYYDVRLKRDRAALLASYDRFVSVEAMLEDEGALLQAMEEHRPTTVIHLAAQAGVRYSLENPGAYIQSNLSGTFNVLEAVRVHRPQHFMFASTSSIYGGNEKQPFTETDRTDYPVSLYAATKRGCESMTHSYAHLHGIPTTCFRFFTVYGPWGRPDMALFRFVERIQRDEPIQVYGFGEMERDFTYIDDLVESIVRLRDVPPRVGEPVSQHDSLSPIAPWRTVNLAGGNPIALETFIETVEAAMGTKAVREMLPMQQGDVRSTHADPTLLNELTGYVPTTPVERGVHEFVDWYKEYFAHA
ncbi:NAD-dependent epimerase/dehydratase family protein [Microbacterium sp. RG1]|uniref:NAD-dependent epimerase/dehydratase family protein n=1 Tax=Microbacterium sp. RG1 TaxID=2489212 RepID=UPI0010CA57C8|nr:NAD-dependent epimerase/dehydratase family protein [Microbacterium sp. RG1]QCQ17990.1 NAD-dependent epimerase/dehydratase family protein [Microbacterium sp. RG1]